jgi:hypothetical protein
MADPKFVLVMSVNPHRDGGFSRAGLRFDRSWRALELGENKDRDSEGAITPEGRTRLDNGVIGPDTYAMLKAEPFLALRPATAEEVEQLAEDRAKSPADKDSELAVLRAKNADLEARLMKLELAAQGGKGGGKPKDEQPPKG